MSVMRTMIEQRRLAARARCRITGWRMTEWQAMCLCDEIAPVLGLSSHELFFTIAQRKVTVLGSLVALRPNDLNRLTVRC